MGLQLQLTSVDNTAEMKSFIIISLVLLPLLFVTDTSSRSSGWFEVCPRGFTCTGTFWAPVCGTDGKTYPNECVLELDNDCSRDVAKAHDGDCDGSGQRLVIPEYKSYEGIVPERNDPDSTDHSYYDSDNYEDSDYERRNRRLIDPEDDYPDNYEQPLGDSYEDCLDDPKPDHCIGIPVETI